MKSDRFARLRHLATLWTVGSMVLAFMTWVCFELELDVTTTAFVFLIVIVLLSLMDSLISSVVFSVIAIGCLDFFFVKPLFSFQVGHAHDATALTAFLASFILPALVRRVRGLADLQRNGALSAEARRELQITIDTIPVLVARHRRDGTRDFGNRQLRDYLGPDVSIEDTAAIVHPDDLAHVDEAWRSHLASGEPSETEQRLRRADGEYRWHLVRRAALRDESGDVIQWYAVGLDIEDKKRAEAALRWGETQLAEAKRELQATIDTIPALVASYDPDGARDFVNQPWQDYMGLSLADSRTGVVVVAPDDVEFFQVNWRDALAKGHPLEIELRLRRADGEYRWHTVRRVPLRDEHNNIVKWYGVAFEIEDRKRAEAALRQSEDYLAEAQRLSHTGSFGWNVTSGDIFWSHEAFCIFGYDPAMKPSVKTVLQRVHPDDVARVRQVINRATNDREGFDLEHRLLMPDGSVKHLYVVAHAVDERGKLEFVGAVMDISARKGIEEALRQSEQRYRHLFQHMPIALWQLNARRVVELFEGLRAQGVMELGPYIDQHPGFLRQLIDALVVDEVNEQTIHMFGARDASELAGSTARFWEPSLNTFRRAMETRFRGEPTFQEETKIMTLDGRVIDVLFTAARPGPTHDRPISLIGIIDMTERVRAREMLQRVQAEFAHAARVSMLGELTASIAHEINQPLAAIAARGETGLRWLDRSDPNITEALKLTKHMVADARRAADIIARIRAMATRQAPERTMLSIDDVIHEALLFLRHEVQSHALTVTHHPVPGASKVLADRTQLQQVIVNLAINAMQAMAHAGSAERKIAIRTAVHDQATLRCTVEDSGPGIKPNDLDHLFDSFFTTKDAGMGLGLAISRSIIEAHGGSIGADNSSVHGGARFNFTLPAAVAGAG
jgi:PAS domain S-box-containing protein